jgi:tetratricopeptide (TPR) repeat protein
MHSAPNVDTTKTAVIGFSWGGTSDMLVAIRNSRINAAISFDGSIYYQYNQYFKSSPYARWARTFDIPFIFLAQKPLPIDTMIAYKMDVVFTFFDSLKYNDAFWVTFSKFSHQDFGSNFIRFLDRESQSERANIEDANEGYRYVCLYTLNFLNGYVKGDKQSYEYLQNNPEQNEIPPGVLTVVKRPGLHTPQLHAEFARVLITSGLDKASQTYSEIRKKDPDFVLTESEVNKLGYVLLSMNKTKEAIDVFRFNAELYPLAFNTYDSLGEAYMLNGDSELAIKNYEKSLELNPNNTNAIKMLKTLRAN